MKIIQSRRKEAKEKIKELAFKSQYAVNLYYQHLDIEYKKVFSNQPFNLPESPDNTSIFNVELFRPPVAEDQYNGMDHLECALSNAQKVCQESIVWTTYYSELEDMEQEVEVESGIEKPKDFLKIPLLRSSRMKGQPLGKGIKQLCQQMNSSFHRSFSRFSKIKALNCLITFKVNIPSMTTHRCPSIPISIIFLPSNN